MHNIANCTHNNYGSGDFIAFSRAIFITVVFAGVCSKS